MTQHITADSPSPSVYFWVADDTGKAKDDAVAADLDLWYQRERGVVVPLSLTDLAEVDSAYSAGGVINIGSDLYRLDLPTAAVTAGVSSICIGGTCDGGEVIGVTVHIVPTAVNANVVTIESTAVGAIQSGLSTLTASQVWEHGTRTLSSFGSLIADIWTNASRTLTAFSFSPTPSNAADTTAIKAVTDGLDDKLASIEQAIDDSLTGANTVTITVDDGGSPIEGARVRVTKSALTEVQQTNVSGTVVFALDDGTWTVSVTAPGFAGETHELEVSGHAGQSYSLTQIVPTPVDYPWINARIICYDAAGNVRAGAEMHVIQVHPTTLKGIASGGETRIVASDSSGVVSLPVLPGGRYNILYDSSDKSFFVNIPEDAQSGYLLVSVIS